MKTDTHLIQKPSDGHSLVERIELLITEARKRVISTVNTTMVYTYFEIGRMIVEEEQNGEERAEYGKMLIKNLSIYLTSRFGKGFSARNLEQMRQFYVVYKKAQTLSADFRFSLSWSHYLKLMRITNPDERNFYEIEAMNNNWSLRELERQYDSSLYERLILSRDKEAVKALSEKGQLVETPQDVIKDPYILEFIGLPELPQYNESELEQRLIDNLQTFLLELGKGFTFVGRQVRFTFDEQHFRVDLVFYNRLLRAFVLIDLKRGMLKHQDLGQMQMYVNYYDRFVKLEDESPTIGILLCADKSDAMVEITLPQQNNQIFASKYQTILPSKETLKKLIEQQYQ
ncbi:PDDEXK nuclease domain-containing protein [Parabacteroides gordonii]|jgi:predicted nuclease of restriction endonuclease-like (RecB) superfamily|uniref:PDDEXK nuclease domain-containing protein n=1 Tax=Parabacteroides gordonii TaxID=574930 RepID=UPI00241DFAB9|nr:PDDEXK nuclease domain-containing protein [Parabacteroides gordonii]